MQTHTIVNELVTTAKTKTKSEVCVSLYLNSSVGLETQLTEQLRPSITNVLKEKVANTNMGTVYAAIAETLREQLKDSSSKADGYALFFIFDTTHNVNDRNTTPLRYSKVIPLFSKPDKEIFIGNIFNIIQLLHSFKVQPSAFGLDVNRERATLYLFDKHECTHIQTFETEIIPDQDAEYSEKQAATGMIHGTGQDKVERKHIEENKYLLHQLKEVLTQMQEQVQDVGHIVVAYTSQFKTIMDPFIEQLQKEVQPVVVSALQKNVHDAKELQEEVEKILTESHLDSVRQQYEVASETFSRFSLDTDLIFDAVTQGSIQTLFVKVNESLSGYITDQVIFSKKAVSDISVFYENIIPFLAAHVYETDGTIVALSSGTEDVPLLAALFRYDKDQIVSPLGR